MLKLMHIIFCLSILAIGTTALADDYDIINNKIEKMTKLQREDYIDSLIGTSFKGCGKVLDVTRDVIQIDNSSYGIIVLDLRYFFIFKTPRKVALSINKGEHLCFEGIITRIENSTKPDISLNYLSSDKDIKDKK